TFRSCDMESDAPSWEEVQLPGRQAVALEGEGPVLSTDGMTLFEGEGEAPRVLGRGLPYVSALSMSVEPQGPGRIAVWSGSGVMISADAGATWSPATNCFETVLPIFERETGTWSPRVFGLSLHGDFMLSEDDGDACIVRG